MRNVKVWVLSLLLIGAVSCSKDDEPANRAPVVEAKTFTVDETATGQIGTVTASDPDGDEITLGISTNYKGLYLITDTGALSLAAGKSLDGEASHTITVTAFDGSLSGEGKITINVNNVNKAPEIAADQVFEVDENVEGAEVGTVDATDPDGDTLTFEIVTDVTDPANGLFVIDGATGILSLDEGKTLDFEGTPSYTLTVSVTDGTFTTEAEITINVIDDELLSDDPNSFITVWTTDVANVEITLNSPLGLENEFIFDYVIDWGDGSEVEELTSAKPTHVYEEPGTYTVAIQGQFPRFIAEQNGGDYFTSMEQWGNIQWESLEGAFRNIANMDYNATDKPDLLNVKNIESLFSYSNISFKTSIADWDVSNITHMSSMFFENESFNEDISGWDVSSVISMSGMFGEATAFNQPIGAWGEKTSNVIDTNGMFSGAISFNQDISGWDVSSVIDTGSMFFGATAFDQNLGAWDISSVGDMFNMLNNSGMSALNFTDTLIGWANPPGGQTIPQGITLGAENVDYCGDNEDLDAASLKLTLQFNWDLTSIGEGVFCNL